MEVGDRVYRLGKHVTTSDTTCWVLTFTAHNVRDKKVWMKIPFDTVMCYQRYQAHLTAIKDFMDNGHTLMNSGAITKDKFKEQLQMVWYPLVLSFIDTYEKDMVPFDVRLAINDVETHAFGAENTTWPPKVLDFIHNGRRLHCNYWVILHGRVGYNS